MIQWVEDDIVDVAKSQEKSILVFSANSCFTNDNRLVMGAGAAKRVKQTYPNIDLTLARQIFEDKSDDWHIRHKGGYRIVPDYGVATSILPSKCEPVRMVTALQVKRDWQEPADLKLIDKSLEHLSSLVQLWDNLTFVLNCPGIGLGGCKPEDIVEKVGWHLDRFNNVIVCAYNLSSLQPAIDDWNSKNSH